MSTPFKFLMIGAMYENGGNTTHRFLDGHPGMFVYPFESQLGTSLVKDALSSTFPLKYRWPVFKLDATPEEDYFMIIDEECKVRARTSHVSKFRHMDFDFCDDHRRDLYVSYSEKLGRSAANNIEAFMRATFDAWKDFNRSGQEEVYVGYSPILVIDAAKIIESYENSHFLHIVRNPWSAYADTKKRPVPLSLDHYMLGWTLNQYHALLTKKMYPDRISIVRIEDVLADPKKALGEVCQKVGLEANDSLNSPSWNAKELEEVYPWGTIRKATPLANRETAAELSAEEIDAIREKTWQYLDVFSYENYLDS